MLRSILDHIRSDNGPEFIAKVLRDWIVAFGAKTAYIMPGSPSRRRFAYLPGSAWEDGYCESFNSKLRDELLNGKIFYSLKEARIVIENWRRQNNTVRPHFWMHYRRRPRKSCNGRLRNPDKLRRPIRD